MQKITPFLWLDGQSEEAMLFTVGIFTSSMVKIDIQGLRRAYEQAKA